MDIFRALQTVEDLIYEVALWIVFIPKTFAKIIRDPRWAHSYMLSELGKDTKERFASYMSPILFWVTTGIVPYLLVIDYLRSTSGSRVAQETEWTQFLALPWMTRVLLVGIFALGGPLAFSLLIQ